MEGRTMDCYHQNYGKLNAGKNEDCNNILQNADTFEHGILKSKSDVENKEYVNGMLIAKPINAWIEESKSKPIPKMLFSEFWFEGELCILFADTNQGKSILAVQIANSISKGIPVPGFKLEARKQGVLYFDFELSAKQFEMRYSKQSKHQDLNVEHYHWDDNFIRIELNPKGMNPGNIFYEELLHDSIEKTIETTGFKVLIIDNLTYLKDQLEKTNEAASLVKGLQNLIDKHKCSVLILAHTPKRDLSSPITRNHLQGSKMLMNFCDSAFAIGESHKDKHIKYLKQIKVRAMEFVYDSDNVIICELHKTDNFLQLEFQSYGKERDHLRQLEKEDEEAIESQVIKLKKSGNSYREIGKQLGISHMKVKRVLDRCNQL